MKSRPATHTVGLQIVQTGESVKRPLFDSNLFKPHVTNQMRRTRSRYANSGIVRESSTNCGHEQYDPTESRVAKMEALDEGLFESRSME